MLGHYIHGHTSATEGIVLTLGSQAQLGVPHHLFSSDDIGKTGHNTVGRASPH